MAERIEDRTPGEVVAELRRRAHSGAIIAADDVMAEAADTIDSLRERAEWLEEAIAPVVDAVLDQADDLPADDRTAPIRRYFYGRELRALAALTTERDDA